MEVGATVGPETTVCIIEVMKMMNSVPAGVSGTIAEICRRERAAGRVRRAAVPRQARGMRRVFIPNRGEIARADRQRLPRARARVRRRGIGARHAGPGRSHSPTASVCIGPGPGVRELSARRRRRPCGAEHPLRRHPSRATASSPRARALAERAREHGLTFVGPPTSAIKLAGDKLAARAEAAEAGAPVLPGGEVANADEARSAGPSRSATRCWSRRPAGEEAAASSASTTTTSSTPSSASPAARRARRSATTASTSRS